MKKLLLAMVLMPLMVLANTENVGGIEWNYTIKDGKAEVCKGAIPRITTGAITIPSVLGSCPVTSIGDNAFDSCDGLTSVAIPTSVKNIGECAFAGCHMLASVTIPEGVTSIGDLAFYDCWSIQSMIIPSSVTSIGGGAFQDCSKLTSVVIPEGMTSIAESVFASCEVLPSVIIPASVETIGRYAFHGCNGLTSVTIPLGVKSIGEQTFECCGGLESVTIPSSVTSIGDSAFYGCDELETVYVSKGDEKRVRGLLEGSDSDIDMESLSFVELFLDGGPYVETVDGIEWAFMVANGKVTIGSGSSSAIPTATTGKITIPSVLGGCPVTSIGERTFFGCSKLTSVVSPEGVTSIGECAFYDCNSLESVTIPSSVTSIGEGVFANCCSMKDVYFKGNGLIGLKVGAFNGCNGDLVLHAPKGWKGRSSVFCGVHLEVEGSSDAVQQVEVTSTKVVVNYVLNSVRPEFAVPASQDTGFVNVITEVEGGCVAVPSSWADNYPTFADKFGADFTKALAMKTGKKDGAGNDMLVWQDYVAGTDPTDETDVFTASITIVDGNVKISYSPELDAERKDMRKYTIWGKKSLLDSTWTEVLEGKEAQYNFFKVSVRMK